MKNPTTDFPWVHGKWWVALAAVALLASGAASSHIKNEASEFPDIEYSEARIDIVALVAAGIIPETAVFEPDAPLTRWDLASWAAVAAGLGGGIENADVQALAATALKRGLVPSTDGAATFADVDRAFFGTVVAADPQKSPTKAQAATYLAGKLTEKINGHTLLEKRGLQVGPTGDVTRVDLQSDAAGGAHGAQTSSAANVGHDSAEQGGHQHGDHDEHGSYVLSIGGRSLPMAEHGRVANGPTDLTQWQGKQVTRSFVADSGGTEHLIYVEAPRIAPAAADQGIPQTVPVGQAASMSSSQDASTQHIIYGLLVLVAALGLLLFFRRRRTH
jgi:hypothetical protein